MNRPVTITLSAIFFAASLFYFTQAHIQTAAKKSVSLTGVNIAGGDFGDQHRPGIFGHDYFYPKPSLISYFVSKGMNIIRVPVLWERLQHHLGEKLDEKEMRRIDAVVNYATSKGIKTIIEIHNYAAYYGSVIGTPKLPPSALGKLWYQIAERYKKNNSVVFGLMNEPTKLRTEVWLEAANDAIDQIRKTGAKNLILVPGNGWSSARDWFSSKYGTPNSDVMLNVVDPDKNFVFEVHQYFNRGFTGSRAGCQSVQIGVESLKPFTRWARQHHKRGFLGEFGASSDPICLEALNRVLNFMATNNDVWLGWTYWAAGPWPRNYFTNLDPIGGKDRPQMRILEKYINKANMR